MLGSDGDLVCRGPHHFALLPFLFAGHQSPLNQNIIQKVVHHDVVTGVDLSTYFSAVAYDMLRVERKSSLAAPTFRLRSLLGDEIFSPPDTEEVLLDLPDNLHDLRSAVQGPPRSLVEDCVNHTLV